MTNEQFKEAIDKALGPDAPTEMLLGKPGPDPFYLESWRLAVQMCRPNGNYLPSVNDLLKIRGDTLIKDWQQWFYEELKKGLATEGEES